MSVNRRGCIVALLLAVTVLTACMRSERNTEGNEVSMKKLEERDSGYAAGPEQWRHFLACWQAAARRPVPSHSEQLLSSVLAPLAEINTSESTALTSAQSDAIASLEQRLGLKLPQSYKDFLLVYRPKSLDGSAAAVHGLWDTRRVGFLSVIVPQMLPILHEYAYDADDSEYYIYGSQQDDVIFRTRYLKNAIVIGQYSDAMHELIVLYPDSLTMDGEMEAAWIQHSGQFRAPSFAELMRQISASETLSLLGDGLSHPQAMLKGTCAEKLPLQNVWWD
jgi:hypothetical protein